MSKKERDILDVVKMIQKASNSVLGATDHFKFRMKKAPNMPGQDRDAQSVRSQQRQQLQSAKATSHKPDTTQAEEVEHNVGYEEDANQLVIGESTNDQVPLMSDKDNQILSNIDMIIQNLQEQKGRFVTQSGLFDRPKQEQ